MQYLLEYCAQNWVDKLRTEAMKRILNQPRKFTTGEENNIGSKLRVLNRDGEEMRTLLGKFGGVIFASILMMSMAIIWSMAISWSLTLATLIMLPVLFLTIQTYQSVSSRSEGRSAQAAGSEAEVAHEVFCNFKTIRSLILEHHFRFKHDRAVCQALQIGLKRAVYNGILYGMSESQVNFVLAFVFYCGAVLVSTGAFPVPRVLLVLSMLISNISNFADIMAMTPQMQLSKLAASNLLKLSNLPKASHEHEGCEVPAAAGDIAFSNVSFSYPNRPLEFVLKHLDLTFKKGSFTTIVGHSGSGKLTIMNLRLRLYPLPKYKLTTNSRITIKGYDTKQLKITSLRQLIAIVSQRLNFSPGTLAENIAYGLVADSPYNDLASVIDAAKSVEMHEFNSSLPQGYDTKVGPGGMGLSGGQIQRAGIARAFLRQPAILILDEVTSSLDNLNAELTQESIARLLKDQKGLIIIAITHAREMMEIPDNVVVLDRGQVVEVGKFEDLLSGAGPLASLLNNQVQA